MEKRVISTQVMEEDIKLEKSLRPQTLDAYIGQEKAKKNLKVYIEAAKLRMDEAKRLLRESEMQIDEIAVSAGYADAGYFAKVFRKTEHMTPSRYRKMYRNIPAL